jgi:tRNA A37 N6-isopentenylltransferase MiaA
VQRALEVYEITGKPMSELLAESPSEDGREGSTIPEWIDLVSLEPSDRSRLHQNLEKRFDEMLVGGLLEEVEVMKKIQSFMPTYLLFARLDIDKSGNIWTVKSIEQKCATRL